MAEAAVWLVHEKLQKKLGEQYGVDSVKLSELGLDSSAKRQEIFRAIEKWFGGDWPNDPKPSYKARNRLYKFELTPLRIKQTTRSFEAGDDFKSQELIAFPKVMSFSAAENYLGKRP